MKFLRNTLVLSGLACLAFLPLNASASSSTTVKNNWLQQPVAPQTVKQLTASPLAHRRCVRWGRVCKRVKVCSRVHKHRYYSKCFTCRIYRYSSHYGRKYHKYTRTCSYSKVKSLRHHGYRCSRIGRYYKPQYCKRSYWKTKCYRTCKTVVHH